MNRLRNGLRAIRDARCATSKFRCASRPRLSTRWSGRRARTIQVTRNILAPISDQLTNLSLSPACQPTTGFPTTARRSAKQEPQPEYQRLRKGLASEAAHPQRRSSGTDATFQGASDDIQLGLRLAGQQMRRGSERVDMGA
jgi:hypothetical protein